MDDFGAGTSEGAEPTRATARGCVLSARSGREIRTRVGSGTLQDIIRKALARRKELIAELRDLDQFLQTAERFGPDVSESKAFEASLEKIRGAWREAPRPSDLVEATIQILRVEGRPLSRGDLFRRLSGAGVQMPGRDAIRNYGTIIWRSGRFDNVGGGYWPKGEKRPESGD